MNRAAGLQYLAVPLGTATGPAWRAVVRGWPDGYRIFYHAAQLAEMAAICAAGGLLVHHSGEPMSAGEIADALAESAGWCQAVLFTALARLGEGRWDEDAQAWRCTSPQLSITASWQAKRGLPAPTVLPPLVLLGAPLEEEREIRTKRLAANRQRKREYRKKHGAEPVKIKYIFPSGAVGSEECVSPALGIEAHADLTQSQQLADITGVDSVSKNIRSLNKSAAKSHAAASAPPAPQIPEIDELKRAVSRLPKLSHEAQAAVLVAIKGVAGAKKEDAVAAIRRLGDEIARGIKIKSPAAWCRKIMPEIVEARLIAQELAAGTQVVQTENAQKKQHEDQQLAAMRKRLTATAEAELAEKGVLVNTFDYDGFLETLA